MYWVSFLPFLRRIFPGRMMEIIVVLLQACLRDEKKECSQGQSMNQDVESNKSKSKRMSQDMCGSQRLRRDEGPGKMITSDKGLGDLEK